MVNAITKKSIIIFLLVLQFIPLVMFPPESFSPNSQEWWLPILLAILAVIAVIRLISRGGEVAWPWYLLGFSQGFNLISRLLMLMPHSMKIVDGQTVLNSQYVGLTLVSMIFSAFFLWYIELPEVRINMIKQAK
jgi:hypothetical protein